MPSDGRTEFDLLPTGTRRVQLLVSFKECGDLSRGAVEENWKTCFEGFS